MEDPLGLAQRPVDTPMVWEHACSTHVPEGELTIEVGDFPAEALYTRYLDGEPLADLDDWPAAWVRTWVDGTTEH